MMKPLTSDMTPREIDTEWAKLDRKRFELYRAILKAEKAGDGEAAERLGRERGMIWLDSIAPLNEEYQNRGRWNRYFRAVKTGRIHAGVDCGFYNYNTEFEWLTDLAGADEAEMLAQHGLNACAICFPQVQQLPGYVKGKARRARKA